MIGVAYSLKATSRIGGRSLKGNVVPVLGLFFSQNWAKVYLHLTVRALFLGKT